MKLNCVNFAAATLVALAGIGSSALATGNDGRITYAGNYVNNASGWGGGIMSFNTVSWTGAATGSNNPGAFNSFCIETGEHIGGGTYYATINSSVIGGQSANNGAHSTLEATTAWMFTQFATGAFGSLDTNHQGGLQIAIWHSQRQLDNDAGGTGNNSNSHWNSILANNVGAYGLQGDYAEQYYNDAVTAVANGWTNSSVRVVNLYTNSDATGNVQSFLTLIPLPTTGGLAGVGLLAVGARRRRNG